MATSKACPICRAAIIDRPTPNYPMRDMIATVSPTPIPAESALDVFWPVPIRAAAALFDQPDEPYIAAAPSAPGTPPALDINTSRANIRRHGNTTLSRHCASIAAIEEWSIPGRTWTFFRTQPAQNRVTDENDSNTIQNMLPFNIRISPQLPASNGFQLHEFQEPYAFQDKVCIVRCPYNRVYITRSTNSPMFARIVPRIEDTVKRMFPGYDLLSEMASNTFKVYDFISAANANNAVLQNTTWAVTFATRGVWKRNRQVGCRWFITECVPYQSLETVAHHTHHITNT
jgi:hypothetical protein